MWTSLAFRKNRGSCRLYCHDLDIWILLFQISTDTCQCSACTNTCYEDVYFSVCVFPDLRTCGCSVCRRVCRIYKLSRDIAVRDFFCQLLCFCDGTFHTLCTFCQYQFCTICFQDVSSFNTHRVRHGQDNAVSFCCCDGCQSDAGISGGRLDDNRTFFQKSFVLSVFDHALCNTVFYASCRVKVLKLCQDCC